MRNLAWRIVFETSFQESSINRNHFPLAPMKVAAVLQLRLIHVVDDNLPIKFTQRRNDAHAARIYVCVCVFVCVRVKVTTIFPEAITGELQASGPRGSPWFRPIDLNDQPA